MTERPVLRWTIRNPDPRRKLLWFCIDDAKKIWVEPMKVETTDTLDEVMSKVRVAISECCDSDGRLYFATDSTSYKLKRVELRTNGVPELGGTLKFTPELTTLNPHILVKIITLPNSATDTTYIVNKRFHRDATLLQAMKFSQELAIETAANQGWMEIEVGALVAQRLLDRIEVYYDGVFEKMYPLDYGTSQNGE